MTENSNYINAKSASKLRTGDGQDMALSVRSSLSFLLDLFLGLVDFCLGPSVTVEFEVSFLSSL